MHERQFNCNHCDKNFVLKDDLRVHKRIHTREKPFKCQHCDKTFVQNDDLRVHKRLHTCKKHSSATNVTRLFVQNDDLRVHESLHTCEKPFKCHFYDEKFDQKDKLREHAKIHTGKKTPQTSRVRLGMAGPVVRTPAKWKKRSKGTQQSPKPSTSQQQDCVAQTDFTADSPSLAGNSVSTELLFMVLAALYICLFQPHSFPIGKSLSFLFPKKGACSPSFSSVC